MMMGIGKMMIMVHITKEILRTRIWLILNIRSKKINKALI